jgi:hypothetical protein
MYLMSTGFHPHRQSDPTPPGSRAARRVAPRIAGLVPYVYTASYEGGERTPEMFLTGEIPSRQLLPAMQWLNREHGRGCAALARRRGDHAPHGRRRG